MITLFNCEGEGVNVVLEANDEIKQLQERNYARIQVIKQQMGTKYLLHPENRRPRLTTPR